MPALWTPVLAVLLIGMLLGGQVAVGSASVSGRQAAASTQEPRIRPLTRLALAGSASAGTPSTVKAAAAPGNFPFKKATSADGRITVHYYHQPASFAQKIIALAQQDLADPIRVTLGFALKQPVNIYVYGSRADFLAGAPVTNPSETGAITLPHTNTVYLQSSDPGDDGATDALPHELTHIVFHQNEDVGHLPSVEFEFEPLWLDEGLAAYDEPANSLSVGEYEGALNAAVTSHHLIDILRDFNLDYPKDPHSDELAYAESRAFIGYLIQVYGLPTIHQFLDDIRDGQLALGAQSRFGADLPMLVSRWETTLGLPPTVKDQGFAPILSTPFPFKPGTMFPQASQTTPVEIPAPVDLLPFWEIATLFALLALVVLLMLSKPGRRRRYVERGVLLTVHAELWQPTAPTEQGERWEPGIASDMDRATQGNDTQSVLPYPMPLETLYAQTEAQTRIETEVPVKAQPEPVQPAKLTPRARLGYVGVSLLVLPLPLVAVAGFAAVQLDPRHEWHIGYVAAALAGGICGMALLGRLLILRRGHRLPSAYIAGLLLAIVVTFCTFAQATPAGLAQAHAYEARDAYALALRTYAGAGEPARQLAKDEARVHEEWAHAALQLEDFLAATTQYNAAILTERRYASASQDRMALLAAIAQWGQGLRAEGKFDAALIVYTGELASPACDAVCAGQMRSGIGTTYLAWAGALARGGNYSGALANLDAVTVRNADASTYSQAQAAAREVAALQNFEAALQAGAHGNAGGMNAQFSTLLARYPNTAAARMAREAAEPVNGVIADASGASTAGYRLYFLAFSSQAQAQGFQFDFTADGSVFKVATTVGAGGAFSVRLPAGYWYVPCWDDPAWASNNYLNASMSDGNSAFLVPTLTPVNVGQILGF